jgi:glycosyltransferase involved in cell wall biosynthesis
MLVPDVELGVFMIHASVNAENQPVTSTARPRSPRVSVVIPALNEARNLPFVLAALPPVHEVIVVDGRSTDDTVAVTRALRPDARIVMQTRRGKGNALACGFAVVTGDIIVMLDADGSTDPGEIPRFVEALVKGADFAKGTRFVDGGGSTDITRVRQLGNKALNGLVNLMYGTRYTDLCYGYNAFWRYCLEVMEMPPQVHARAGDEMIWGDGFEVETLINVRIAKAGLRVREVGSFERERLHGRSNLHAVADGLRVLRTVFAEARRRSTVHPVQAVPGQPGRQTISGQPANGRCPR